VITAADLLAECLRAGGTAYVIGNGGSAADAQHFAAEFTGRFTQARRPLPVVALTADSSVLTCIGNDFGFEYVFARQVQALGHPADVLVAISTSGNSPDVIQAARAARRIGMTVIGLTGRIPAELDALSDLVVKVPSAVTARIQECQMTLLHVICDLTERALFPVPEPLVQPIVLPSELLAQRQEWRRQGLTVVSTNGCFDVLHTGHLDSLRRAAALGDVLVVLLNSDDSVRRAKGPSRPVNSFQERADLLAALEPVDHVCVFTEDDPSLALTELQPDIHCKGEEYALGHEVPERAAVESYGGRMEFLPRRIEDSTTAVLARLEVH
jgi:phosphoheptose isomerase